VRFLFDFLSPYAYTAWHLSLALAARHGRALEPEPVLLAGLLGAHGTKGPAEIPAKRVYTFKDAFRKATVAGLPLLPPPSHPFNPLLALRVVLATPLADRERLITALWRGAWGGGGGVEDPANVVRLAREAGLDGEDLVARAPGSKNALRAATEAAVREGVFGVPTLFVDGEMFWGVDALPFAELRLQGRDPFDPATLRRWSDLPATARRSPPA
jgi:2-hydroxychromene-2-carboxylate isomerase